MLAHNRCFLDCIFIPQKYTEEGIVWTGEPIHNMVLDNGLLKLFTRSVDEMTSFINIGNSAVATAADQTGLLGFLFSSGTIVSETPSLQTVPYKHLQINKVFSFAIGSCTGEFAEVGLSRLSNEDYYNRQIFKNGGGDPIVISIAANEGLILTAQLKMYFDPNICRVGEKLELDVNGATAGTVTFHRGSAASTPVTIVNDNTIAAALLDAVEELVDPDLIVGVTPTLDGAGPGIDYWTIEFKPLAGITGLSITFADLVGNTGDPTITVDTANPRTAATWTFTDITGSTTTTVHTNKSEPLTGTGVWVDATLNNPLYAKSFANWTYKINNQLPDVVNRTDPTISSFQVTDVCTWLPTKISGTTYNVKGLKSYYDDKEMYEFRFVESLPLENTEEMTLSFRRSWGRWSDVVIL